MSGGADDALRSAADELYAAPAAEFTARRTALSRRARQDGDRDLAARIGALAKPSAAAGLVNDLVRSDGGDLRSVLELGQRLRAAQERADRAALQALTAERRRLIAEVTERAADHAGEIGRRPGAGVLEEFQQTLTAALVSADAADAVRSGRLVRGLTADGLEAADLDGAVAVPGGLEPLPAPVSEGDAEPADAEDVDRDERARAAKQQAAVSARRRAVELRARADTAGAEAADAEQTVRERQSDTEARRSAVDEARDALRAAERSLEEAVRAVNSAEEAGRRSRRAAAVADAAARDAEADAEKAEEAAKSR